MQSTPLPLCADNRGSSLSLIRKMHASPGRGLRHRLRRRRKHFSGRSHPSAFHPRYGRPCPLAFGAIQGSGEIGERALIHCPGREGPGADRAGPDRRSRAASTDQGGSCAGAGTTGKQSKYNSSIDLLYFLCYHTIRTEGKEASAVMKRKNMCCCSMRVFAALSL